MMAVFPNENDPGLLVQTTDAFDFNTQIADVNSPEFRVFVNRLNNRINDIATALNLKDSGKYPLTEFVDSKTWFPNPALNFTSSQTPTDRGETRKVFYNIALTNPLTQIPHGINPLPASADTPGFSFVDCWGMLNDTTNRFYLPIPYVNVSGTFPAVEIYVDAVNINITIGGAMAGFTVNYIVLEYLKN